MFKKIKKVMEFIKEKKETLIAVSFIVGWFVFIALVAILST